MSNLINAEKKYTLAEVAYSVQLCLRTNIVCVLHSQPGLGKSSLLKTIAEERNLKVIDVRLAQMMPEDLNGLPFLAEGKASYHVFDTFPIETDEVPEGYDGWLLFFDEITSAPKSIQAACYKIILDRMVGQFNLHPKCYIVAAGNLITDGAVVEPMSTALLSRMAHFYIRPDLDEWLRWANHPLSKGEPSRINPFIQAYLKFKPEHFHTFKNNTTKPFACPRTLEMFSRVLDNEISLFDQAENFEMLASSLLGESVAIGMLGFLDNRAKIQTFEEIVKNPMSANIYPYEAYSKDVDRQGERLGLLWSTMHMLASNVINHLDDKKIIEAVNTYILRITKLKGQEGGEQEYAPMFISMLKQAIMLNKPELEKTVNPIILQRFSEVAYLYLTVERGANDRSAWFPSSHWDSRIQ